MRNWIRVLACAGLLVALLSACSGIDYNLYGAWRNDEIGLTLEFKQNGTLLVTQQGQAEILSFSFAGPGAFSLTRVGAAAQQPPETKQYVVQGDKMTLALDQPTVFTRLK